ncbi:MAG: HDIG domain-containing metalloprotein [Nitrolancea sp.]
MNSTSHGDSQFSASRVSWFTRRTGRRGSSVWRISRFVLFGLSIFMVLGLVLYFTWQSDSLNLKAGEIANRTIKAPRTATFESDIGTQERQQEAYDDSRNIVLKQDDTVAPAQLASLRQALDEIDSIRSGATPVANTNMSDQIRSVLDGLSASDATSIALLSSDSWSRVSSEATRLLAVSMADQVKPEDVASVKESLLSRSNVPMSLSERELAVALAKPFVRANVTVDDAQTKAAREAAARAVEPVMLTVQEGQVIVRDGDPVTKDDIEKLDFFNLLTPSHNWQQFIGVLGLLGFVTLGLVFYLYKFARGLWQNQQLLLVGLVIVVPVVAGRFWLLSTNLKFMFPAAAAVMLLSVLLDFQVAVVSAGFLALYLGIVAGNAFDVTFFAFLSGVAGAAVIWRAERTMTFLWAGFGVAVSVFVSAILFALVHGNLGVSGSGTLVYSAVANGGLSASLTFLSFSVLGRIFGITTHLQLLELAHPNQPLLYRLAREAPGTYHHSIMVSNLAESAVEHVGGDPLFTRVAVLYHDVGKVLRPSFFVENQANRANVHDALDPRTSARIIQEHVLDGVRLGKKAHLPQTIIDVIQQHHGTSLIKYFYTEALNNGEDVNESDFRYAGPKPQTKEAGVIMLADSVEAAVRAASQSGKLYEEQTPPDGKTVRRAAKLQQIVDGVIKSRLDDGQLDECDLTLKQVEQIRTAFVSILEGIYHPRVEYPELKVPLPHAKASAQSPVEVS